MERAELAELFGLLKGVADRWNQLGVQLNFEVSELNVIESNVPGERQLFELLKIWLKRTDSNRSERKTRLREALNSIGDNVLSRDIGSSDYSSLSSEPNEFLLRSISMGNSSLDDEVFLRTDEEVESALQEYDRRFIHLQKCICVELKTQFVVVDEFLNTITFLPISIKEEYEYYIDENADRLEELKSTKHIMIHLNKYWNFFDYGLLEFIIEEYGSERLKRDMQIYASDLKEFRKNTTVRQFMRCWPGRKDIPPRFERMDIALDVDPEVWNLEKLERMRKDMYKQTHLTVFAFIVHKLKEGCIVVVWAVPRECLSAIIRCELSESFITEPKVLSIKIADVVLDKKMLLNVCSQGKVELVRSLIESGVDLNSEVRDDNSTALHLASQNGNREIVELLLESKAKVEAKKKNEATPLLMASYAGHTDVVELLLSKGANLNAKTDEGQTPLTYASFRGHTDLAKLLLTQGAKVNQANKFKATPLIFASEHGYIEIVTLLLEHGADVKLRNQGNASPLSYACQNGHPEVVRLLLKYNAPTEEKNEPGATPLIVGSAVGQTSVVEVMLDHQANINATTSKMRLTSLMIASLNDHLKVVQLLLHRGAKVDAQSKDGFTALIIATKNENEKIVKALLSANADPNLFEKETRWTAIFFAAKSGNIGIINMLIEHGANVNHRDKNYITAMDVSTQAPNPEDVQHTLSVHSKVKFQELNKKNSDKVHKASHHVEDLFISFAKFWAPALEKRLLAERERRSRSTESGQQQMLTSVVVS